MISENKREYWIDVVKWIAIMCVVLCHSIEAGVYQFDLDWMAKVELPSRTFAFTSFGIGRIGVALFMFATGYLLLDRKYDDEACKKFWKTKLLGLFVATEIWTVIYEVFRHFFDGKEITVISLIKQLVFIEGSSLPHLWYMRMILGIYLTIPFVANVLQMLKKKTVVIAYVILFSVLIVTPTVINLFSVFGYGNIGKVLLSSGFGGDCYGLYVLMGYFVKKGELKKISSPSLSLIAVCSYVCYVAMMMYSSYKSDTLYNAWYDNIFVFICSGACFELMSRLEKVPFKKALVSLSKYTFAMYLTHYPIVYIARRLLTDVTSRPVRVALVWAISLVGSMLVSYLISKIPKIGKTVLYMR